MRVETYRGTWEEIGRALGKRQRLSVRKHLKRGHLSHALKRLVAEQMGWLKEHAPGPFACLVGLAAGAQVDLEHVIAIHSWEYDFLDVEGIGHEHCTTALVADRQGRLLLVHNEDEDVGWLGQVGFVRLEPRGAPTILALQYRGMLPGAGVGVNSAGIALTMDNIWRKKHAPCIGLPPTVLGLEFLSSRTDADLQRAFRQTKINAGSHYLATHGKLAWSFEFFPDVKTQHAVQSGFVHANHAVWGVTRRGSFISKSSSCRYEALSSAMEKGATRERAIRCLRTPMDEGGVLRKRRRGQDVTLMTVVAFPSAKRIDVWSPRGWKKITV